MSTAAVVIVSCAIGTIVLKAAGPLLLGGRPLPPRLGSVVSLAGPALLAALVATSTLASGTSLVDRRAPDRARRRRDRDPVPRARAPGRGPRGRLDGARAACDLTRC